MSMQAPGTYTLARDNQRQGVCGGVAVPGITAVSQEYRVLKTANVGAGAVFEVDGVGPVLRSGSKTTGTTFTLLSAATLPDIVNVVTIKNDDGGATVSANTGLLCILPVGQTILGGTYGMGLTIRPGQEVTFKGNVDLTKINLMNTVASQPVLWSTR